VGRRLNCALDCRCGDARGEERRASKARVLHDGCKQTEELVNLRVDNFGFEDFRYRLFVTLPPDTRGSV
jgi:hypothetical protein